MKYNTKQRQIIIDYFNKNKKAISIKDLSLILKDNISKATLYREIDNLVNEGKLLKIYNSDKNIYEYELSDFKIGCDKHLHLKCDVCGKIYHLDDSITSSLNSIHFMINYSQSFIHGVCQTCNNKK